MAAEDLGVEMVVVSTEEKLSVQEQQSLIENEIENGADAVIVQPACGAGAEEMLQKIGKRIPIMLVEYTASREKDASALPAVRPDNGGMGTALAEEILKDYEGNLEGKTMGIVSSTPGYRGSAESPRRISGCPGGKRRRNPLDAIRRGRLGRGGRKGGLCDRIG